MSKEKQIEEILKTLYKAEGVLVVKDAGRIVAETLYNAGYRKASDVAREIVNDVKETLLDYHLRENKKYGESKTKSKKQFDVETARLRAITDAIKFAIETLNGIEKKYTEGVNENTK